MSNRVTGARLKAAALIHSRKQLGALGTIPAGVTSIGTATFQGEQAYAVWNVNEYGDNDQLVRSYRINYPAMPDNALVSRREADLISAYTLHELGHIAFTNNVVVKGISSARFQCWNGIEDARIERAVIASGKARGARSAFKKLMGKFTVKLDGDAGFNPTKIGCAPLTLALVCRAALGDGNGFAKTLLDRIPEPKRSLYAKVVDGMTALPLDRTGTAAAMALANEFVDAWLALEPEALKQPMEQPVQQPSGAASSDEFDEDEDGESESSSSAFSDDDAADDQDDPDADSESLAGAGDDDADEADDSVDVSDDIANSTEDDAPAGNDALDMGDDTDGDDDGSATDGASDKAFDDVSEPYDDDTVYKAEPSIDDLFKAIADRTKGPIDLRAFQPARRSQMSKWSSLNDADEVKQRREFRKLHKVSLPALKSAMYRILRAPERNGWDTGALGGRFDGKRTTRMMAGSECVFKRRWTEDGIDTVVSVIVDLSGSMKGESLKQSVDLAWTIAEAAEAARARVEVVGFTNAYGRGNGVADYGFGLDGAYNYGTGSNYRSGECATLAVAKRFGDRCANVAANFNMMKRIAAGSTPDYSSIRTVCETLSAMPQQRKLVVVITDGYGDTAEMAKLTRSSYDMYGVDIIGFGIGCWGKQFGEVYALGSPVMSLDTLHTTALKAVVKQLDLRDTRRAA